MRRPVMTQYNIQFSNDGAVLDRLTQLLVKEKIAMNSMLSTSVGEKSAIQFLAPKDPALREKLEETGVAVREDLVFQVEMPNSNTELHKLAHALAEKSINIVSLYSTIDGENMRIVLAVDDPANAVALIEKLGFKPDYSVDRP